MTNIILKSFTIFYTNMCRARRAWVHNTLCEAKYAKHDRTSNWILNHDILRR